MVLSRCDDRERSVNVVLVSNSLLSVCRSGGVGHEESLK